MHMRLIKGTMLVCAALLTLLTFSSPTYASCERQHRVSDGDSN